MFLNCGVGEDSWESLGQQGDQTSQSWKKSVLNIHWKDLCWSWSSNTLATWYEELTHWKRPCCWERLKAGGKGDDRGWDGWMASPTRWTWIWVNSRSGWWTGKPGVLQFMGSQGVGHDWSDLAAGLQHARLPCPSPTPGACSNSCPSSRWCRPTISSSVVSFSSCLQSFPASGSFPVSHFFCIRWPKYWSFSFSISLSNEYSGLISFRMDWLDLLEVQGTLKSLLQHHSSKASILQCWAFFTVQSHIHTWPQEKP